MIKYLRNISNSIITKDSYTIEAGAVIDVTSLSFKKEEDKFYLFNLIEDKSLIMENELLEEIKDIALVEKVRLPNKDEEVSEERFYNKGLHQLNGIINGS